MSAVQARQRPTAALLELDDPFSGWCAHDYKLQEAVLILDRDKCQNCGNPSWLCHTANNEVEFEIRSGWCYGKAELEDYADSMEAPKLEAGEYRYAVAVGIKNEDGTHDPLPSRRAALEQLATVVRKDQ